MVRIVSLHVFFFFVFFIFCTCNLWWKSNLPRVASFLKWKLFWVYRTKRARLAESEEILWPLVHPVVRERHQPEPILQIFRQISFSESQEIIGSLPHQHLLELFCTVRNVVERFVKIGLRWKNLLFRFGP